MRQWIYSFLTTAFVLGIGGCAHNACRTGASANNETCPFEHAAHDHEHKAGCGHKQVKHGDHMDYEHDGHLHARHLAHTDEHKACHKVEGHAHKHGKNCGHKAVKHGDHMDYQHDNGLHATHGDHVDNHQG